MIQGTIATKEVLVHAFSIVRHFGPRAFLRCCRAILVHERTTFLDCVCRMS